MVLGSNGQCIAMKRKSTRWFAFAFLLITIVITLIIGCYQSIMHLGPQSNGGIYQADPLSLMQA
jgi:disulfide bond formation protein DsbB